MPRMDLADEEEGCLEVAASFDLVIMRAKIEWDWIYQSSRAEHAMSPG